MNDQECLEIIEVSEAPRKKRFRDVSESEVDCGGRQNTLEKKDATAVYSTLRWDGANLNERRKETLQNPLGTA